MVLEEWKLIGLEVYLLQIKKYNLQIHQEEELLLLGIKINNNKKKKLRTILTSFLKGYV